MVFLGRGFHDDVGVNKVDRCGAHILLFLYLLLPTGHSTFQSAQATGRYHVVPF
jgi:hypothetical protein